MVKKVLVIFFFSFAMISNVLAEPYYENDNGVQFSEDEYNFISALYGEYKTEVMTLNQYNKLKENNIFGQEIITISDDSQISLLTEHETPHKKLTLSYACGTKCTIVSHLFWKVVPATKSYDLYGTYLENTGEIDELFSVMHVNGSITYPVEYKINSAGASATYKLPDSISNTNDFFLDFEFMVAQQGKIYVSYQHADSAVSLANSRLYNFSYNGYGHVFAFNQSVRSHYDDMGGLKIYFS